MIIEIKLLDRKKESLANWDKFDLDSGHPANTTFFSTFYQRLSSTPLFLEAYAGSLKVCQWLVCKKRVLTKPYCYHIVSQCGPQIISDYQTYYDEIFYALVNYLRNRYLIESKNIVNFALIRGITESALQKCGFAEISKYTAFINKIETDEKNLMIFHKSHRNDTNKAIRDGYRYTLDLSPEEYYNLSIETYNRSNLEGPGLAYLRKIYSNLVCKNKALISGVSVDGKLLAGSIIIYHGSNSYYLHGASSSEKPRGATTFIHYENMKHLKIHGVENYDFGGVRFDAETPKARSLTDFKRRFGGELVICYGGLYKRGKVGIK
jgi:hypothetical protein